MLYSSVEVYSSVKSTEVYASEMSLPIPVPGPMCLMSGARLAIRLLASYNVEAVY